ncbi:MAG: ABC transporter ATP-binding protein [Alphaproteobacteria bacterium]|nr:ABC transporter ATP-binding protein [Alphaproteobacteria bacterium]
MPDAGGVLPAIRFGAIRHAYPTRDGGEVLALDGIDLTVRRGEFVALVGPSGCGKSTLLRLLAGLEKPTRGMVEVEGLTPDAAGEMVGLVFQKPTLLDWLTVERNILLPVRIRRGRPGPADVAAARQLMAMTGIAGFAQRHPSELSGGMQQRAAICRALIQDPEVLLMDEPFGALDALTREEMCFELLRLWSERRKTILFVTHSIPEAVLLADRVVVMAPRPGRIAAEIVVDLPRPRGLGTMADPAFQSATQRIRELIYGDAARAAATATTL